MKINRTFFRFFAYSLEILILYVLQGTPKLLPELFGSKPLLLVPLAIAIAAHENEIPSLIFGAVCGLMTDIATGGTIGFFAIALTLVCYFESRIYKTVFVSTFWSSLVVTAVVSVVLVCLYFVLFTVCAGIADWNILFVNHYISRIVYTFAIIIPLYPFNTFLYRNLHS